MTILRSILITSIVSILFGFALRNVFGFWEALSLAFVLQFIVAFITSSFKINRVENLTTEFQVELEQLLSLSETTIACPCGNYTFTENVFANVESTYVCEKCNNEFKLDVTVTPTLLTHPVNVDQPITALKDDVKITSEYKQGTEL